jgi:hypothetical protein
MAAGMLAMLQMESPEVAGKENWRRPDFRQRNSFAKMYRAAAVATGLRSPPSMSEKLREVMAGDELADANPFGNLSSDDTLNEILNSKITAFERKTLRSPSYQDEAGYDLVHYEILHADGRISSVLAFVDAENTIAGDGAPELQEESVVLMVLTPKDDKNQYAVYRNNTLEEVSLIVPEEGAALLAQRLESGIPFLSVSR